MSMTTNPAKDAQAYAAWAAARSESRQTILGNAIAANGTVIAMAYNPKDHRFCVDTTLPTVGGVPAVAPTTEFTRLSDFLASHRGHPMTRMGPMASDRGTADVWMCQKDNAICLDTLS